MRAAVNVPMKFTITGLRAGSPLEKPTMKATFGELAVPEIGTGPVTIPTASVQEFPGGGLGFSFLVVAVQVPPRVVPVCVRSSDRSDSASHSTLAVMMMPSGAVPTQWPATLGGSVVVVVVVVVLSFPPAATATPATAAPPPTTLATITAVDTPAAAPAATPAAAPAATMPEEAKPAGISGAPAGPLTTTEAALATPAIAFFMPHPAALSTTSGAYSGVRLSANALSTTSM